MSPHRPKPPLRTAVVGTGSIARGSHLPALAILAGDGAVEIVAVLDVVEEAARAAAEEFAVPGVFTDLDTLLDEVRPDLVVLCTPPSLHREQAVAAVRAGAHVWCEKPPCPSLADYDAVTAAAGKEPGAPATAFVFQHRFGSGARHVRRLLNEGAFGRPLVAHCQTTWYRDADYYAVPWRGRWDTEGGGPAMGHGIHQTDLLLDLMGPWREVRAMAARLVHDVQTEDVSTAQVRFANGAVATVVNSVLSPDEVSRIRIDCELATIELTHLYGYRNADWRITPAPGVPEETVLAWRGFGPDEPSSHLAQLRALVADIQAGTPHPTSGEGGRQIVEFTAALYKSAFTDAPVRAGEIGPGDPFYAAMHGGSPDRLPVDAREEEQTV
ncbi:MULTISPECIES: Gfo/Idh/MocA family protein [unclassified Streptomyces]|uniref:Gfo/Idh/MocA family protein n=1 Tax=unclassified Streptomyces TaxID=2593676 RepID=UPI002E1D83A9|nr:Gfo/Idh/MocA family oxidoreductase [Streptomyces sp. NBC_01023]